MMPVEKRLALKLWVLSGYRSDFMNIIHNENCCFILIVQTFLSEPDRMEDF